VLQDREVRPVGSTEVEKIDVRIITATNKDLNTEMEAGNFREDLYYRLNVIPIHIPPLRERPQDVLPLANAFVAKHSPDELRSISREGLQHLAAFWWKGNARELENVIERALALSDAAQIGLEDFPLDPAKGEQREKPPSGLTGLAAERRLTLRELEFQYIDEILRITGGNKVHAAKILGVDRKTLYRKAERRNQQSSKTES
jgi:DNA-binding NtrC family response regulator